MIVVVPPCSAALVVAANVSSDLYAPVTCSTWQCPSTPPGMTSMPVASMERSAGGSSAPGAYMAAI